MIASVTALEKLLEVFLPLFVADYQQIISGLRQRLTSSKWQEVLMLGLRVLQKAEEVHFTFSSFFFSPAHVQFVSLSNV